MQPFYTVLYAREADWYLSADNLVQSDMDLHHGAQES